MIAQKMDHLVGCMLKMKMIGHVAIDAAKKAMGEGLNRHSSHRSRTSRPVC